MITSTINSILVLEPNKYIARGIEYYLKFGNKYKVHTTTENVTVDQFELLYEQFRPQLIITNPIVSGMILREEFRMGGAVVIALLTAPVELGLVRGYNAIISVSDDPEQLIRLIRKLEEDELQSDDSEIEEKRSRSLSPRERDVVIGVAKGLTNKEIADRLDLSTHTIITHRRNIAKKLQIHSPSGLTIYAIANNLVSMDEVENL